MPACPSEIKRQQSVAARLAAKKCGCGAPVKSTRHTNCDACRREQKRKATQRSNERRSARLKAAREVPKCLTCGVPVIRANTRCRPCAHQQHKERELQWRVASTVRVTHYEGAATVAEDAAELDDRFPWLKGCEGEGWRV